MEPEENNSVVSRATMSIPQRGKTPRVLFPEDPLQLLALTALAVALATQDFF